MNPDTTPSSPAMVPPNLDPEVWAGALTAFPFSPATERALQKGALYLLALVGLIELGTRLS